MSSDYEPNVVYQFEATMHRSAPDVPDEFTIDFDSRHDAVGCAALWEREHSPDKIEIDASVLPCPICGEPFVEFLELDSPDELRSEDHVLTIGDKLFAHRHRGEGDV